MKFNRAGGIIMHPTSFPGADGIGDLGVEAYRWVDCLVASGSSIWQILPLGPTGYGDSPYQCFSAFAGNPYLISPLLLLDEGLLTIENLDDRPEFPIDHVDFGPVIEWKLMLLDRAFENFQRKSSKTLQKALAQFSEQQAGWLGDFALFMAIKENEGGGPWNKWPVLLRQRDKNALKEFSDQFSEVIERHIFRQFIFFKQWEQLHTYAKKKGITILGDAPIFVAYDSSDVWSNPDLFFLDDEGSPTVVAGVPPDYFSPTGQLWGNPLYRWDVHASRNYEWWIARLKATLQQVDLIRLDHFRGFAGYWEIPAGMPTAEIGKWVPGPGKGLFETVEATLGKLPIVAEDLGEITPDVFELRDAFNLPGMKILQFGFESDPSDPFLPHNYPQNCVAYTGTHDNDTTKGWYESSSDSTKDLVRRYLARSGVDISWDMMRAIWSSTAVMTLAPMQDILSMGTEARMNFPGKPSGNWSWRMLPNAFTNEISSRLRDMNFLYGRLPAGKKTNK